MSEKHSPAVQKPASGPDARRGPQQPVGGVRKPIWSAPDLLFRLSTRTMAIAAGLQDQYLREQEQRRTFLWSPVLFAAGILVYYQMPREPLLIALVLLAIVPIAIAFVCVVQNRPCQLWIAVLLMALGALTAKIRTDSLTTPQLNEPAFVSLHGIVASVQVRAGRSPRVLLKNPVIESRRPLAAPGRIRVTLLKSAGLPPIGAAIALRARIGAVPGPVVPGGYDPRRAAFFDGVGASGFAVGHWTPSIDKRLMADHGSLTIRIEQVRQAMAGVILQNQPGPACAALFAATIYLFLSGGNVATLRAFIMASIMFAAILANRPALSLRNLAIAALIILAREPESILEPGFQMSFAAVTALIAFYETWRDRPRMDLADPPVTLIGRAMRFMRRFIGATAMTTLIAGLATGPVAAYHFNHVAVYSLAGNLLAMPIVALVVMPFGLLSLIMMPFGLEAWPLAMMALGSTAIMHIAETVSGWSGATWIAAAADPSALFMFMAGFLWICLWRLKWRWLGLIPVAIAPSLVLTGDIGPDVLVTSSGKIVAARDQSDVLRISARQQNQYVLEQWFKREGTPLPERKELSKSVRCDRSACLLTLADGRILAHIRHHAAFDEECRYAEIIVTPLAAPANCQSRLIIDKHQLNRFGAHSITVDHATKQNPDARSGFRITTAYPAIRRSWHGRSPEQP